MNESINRSLIIFVSVQKTKNDHYFINSQIMTWTTIQTVYVIDSFKVAVIDWMRTAP